MRIIRQPLTCDILLCGLLVLQAYAQNSQLARERSASVDAFPPRPVVVVVAKQTDS